MTPRDRVMAALAHQPTDRVPLFYRDIPEVRARLQADLGCPDFEALLRRLDIDFRWVEPGYVGPTLEDPQRNVRRDIWGVEYRYVRFSERAGYWEPIERPLAQCDDPAALDDYAWPSLDWFDFSTLSDQVAAHDGYAIMTAPGVASPGVLQTPIQGLLGEEKSLIAMVANPEFFAALVRRVLEFQLPFIERMMDAANGRIDFFRIGEDLGTQKGLLISPATFRQSLQEPLKAMADAAGRRGAAFYLHSCGSVRALIPDLIAMGVDVLDPLQVGAADMTPAELKAEFGDRLCFSGGVDEQELLPRGSVDDVRAGVRDLLDVMARGGGFFLGPTHNFQDDVPTENVVAMYETAREWEPR